MEVRHRAGAGGAGAGGGGRGSQKCFRGVTPSLYPYGYEWINRIIKGGLFRCLTHHMASPSTVHSGLNHRQNVQNFGEFLWNFFEVFKLFLGVSGSSRTF
jgi:hypothetical protein